MLTRGLRGRFEGGMNSSVAGDEVTGRNGAMVVRKLRMALLPSNGVLFFIFECHGKGVQHKITTVMKLTQTRVAAEIILIIIASIMALWERIFRRLRHDGRDGLGAA